MITPDKYVRKPFEVQAVRVSQSNMEEVAKWCGGEIVPVKGNETETSHVRYIHVKVSRPIKENQTRAFIGDWVLYAGKGWKVYTNRAFEACFDRIQHAKGQPDNVYYNPNQEPLFEAPKECYGIGD